MSTPARKAARRPVTIRLTAETVRLRRDYFGRGQFANSPHRSLEAFLDAKFAPELKRAGLTSLFPK